MDDRRRDRRDRTRDRGLHPARGVHGFDNRGDADARFLAIATPGVFGPAYFREIGELLASPAGPPDPAAIAELMRRRGLTAVPPIPA